MWRCVAEPHFFLPTDNIIGGAFTISHGIVPYPPFDGDADMGGCNNGSIALVDVNAPAERTVAPVA